jgi:hypothetical protein
MGCRVITGYLFRSEELRKYRPVPEVETHPEVFLNFREVAFVLGVRSNIVRALVTQGLLGVARGYRNGFAKLVPENEVHVLRKPTFPYRPSPGDSTSTVVLLRAT